MLVVGLTGGIASGKSTVSRRLEEYYHVPVIDADRIAREVVEPGQAAYKKIVTYFEPKIPDLVLHDKHLNRSALGKWVFSHEKDLQTLNQITHPAVRSATFKKILWYYICGYSICVLDVPLLFESGLDIFCGVSVAVISDQSLQLERLLVRNPEMNEGDAMNRIHSQIGNDERVEKADYILTNNENLSLLYREVDEFLKRIRPSFIRTLLEYFPAFGAISAASIVLSRYQALSQKPKRQ